MGIVSLRMDSFGPYVDSLERIARDALDRGLLVLDGETSAAALLDGQPSARLRDLVPLAVRKANGAFFTGATLAEQALGPYASTLSSTSIVFDPACGAGDLLVACARHLPVGTDLAETIKAWGEQLRGVDIHPEFVRAAKVRLLLLAMSRVVSVGSTTLPSLGGIFPHLQVADGLTNTAGSTVASHIVLNPPYPKLPAAPGCTWGSGKVSLAATFLDQCLAVAPSGVRAVAILPDVLRTGSLYARWRTTIEARSIIESVQVYGAFDSWADVDVFILRLVVGEPILAHTTPWWRPPQHQPHDRVNDHFSVHVGSVVPHRHPKLGHWHPYVCARLLPAWTAFSAERGPRRRFKGRTFMPPFVAVRRTSSPSDRQRAAGTIVVGDRPVAVENHLLVLVPADRSLARCEQVIAVLRDERTNQWLDERIRCRHLTVTALKDLPWWESTHDA